MWWLFIDNELQEKKCTLFCIMDDFIENYEEYGIDIHSKWYKDQMKSARDEIDELRKYIEI